MKALTQIITIAIAGIATSILLTVFVVRPVLADVISTNQTVRDRKIELATLDQQIRAFKTAQTDLAKATRKDEIANAIVPKENLVEAVKALENAAAQTGTGEILSMKEPDSGQAKPVEVISGKQGIDEVGYRVATLNDYIGTIKFLSYLEYLPHFTEIAKIDLSAEIRESTGGAAAVHTGQVIGSFDGVFFIKTPQP